MLNHNLFSFNFTYCCIYAQFQVVALCHGLHVEVRGERCRVSFLLHLYAGSVDEIQGTGLCSFVYLFICCLRQSLSRSLPFQQHCLASKPGSCLSWTLDAAARPNSMPGTHTQVRMLVQQALHPLSHLPTWKPLIVLCLKSLFYEERWRECFLDLPGGWQPRGVAKRSMVATVCLCVLHFLLSVCLSLFKTLSASSRETLSFFPNSFWLKMIMVMIMLCF